MSKPKRTEQFKADGGNRDADKTLDQFIREEVERGKLTLEAEPWEQAFGFGDGDWTGKGNNAFE